jgi:hypothetical protein
MRSKLKPHSGVRRETTVLGCFIDPVVPSDDGSLRVVPSDGGSLRATL